MTLFFELYLKVIIQYVINSWE